MKHFFSLQSFSFAFDQQGPLFFDTTSLSVTTPGISFVIGKNGSGKSTLFRLLQGIVHSNERVQGKVTVQDHEYDMTSLVDRNRLYQRCMILHQSFDSMLAPSFTGYENLAFAKLDPNPSLSLLEVSRTVSDFAQQFQLPLEKSVYQLSGGQRQMLALLMVTQKPIDLLLLDEPTAALDPKNSDYLMQGILSLAKQRNITVLCVSHDHDLVQRYSTHRIEILVHDNGVRTMSCVA